MIRFYAVAQHRAMMKPSRLLEAQQYTRRVSPALIGLRSHRTALQHRLDLGGTLTIFAMLSKALHA
jgi:hypothetical protein